MRVLELATWAMTTCSPRTVSYRAQGRPSILLSCSITNPKEQDTLQSAAESCWQSRRACGNCGALESNQRSALPLMEGQSSRASITSRNRPQLLSYLLCQSLANAPKGAVVRATK